MINVWDYQDAKKVRITDIDGKEYFGSVIEVIDAQDRPEDNGCNEDGIVLATESGEIEFLQSEITAIECL